MEREWDFYYRLYMVYMELSRRMEMVGLSKQLKNLFPSDII